MTRENLSIGWNCRIRVDNHETGETREIHVHNLIPDVGLNKIRDLLAYPDPDAGGANNTPHYIAVGSSSTATTSATTVLGGEVLRKPISHRFPENKALKFYLYVAPSEANGGGSQALREVGLFSESSGGTLWARVVHGLITKTSAISITYEWTFSMTAS